MHVAAARVTASRPWASPLADTFVIEGLQPGSSRQVLQRAALHPYRSHPDGAALAAAVTAALAWAEGNVGPVNAPIDFRVIKVHYVYANSM